MEGTVDFLYSILGRAVVRVHRITFTVLDTGKGSFRRRIQNYASILVRVVVPDSADSTVRRILKAGRIDGNAKVINHTFKKIRSEGNPSGNFIKA